MLSADLTSSGGGVIAIGAMAKDFRYGKAEGIGKLSKQDVDKTNAKKHNTSPSLLKAKSNQQLPKHYEGEISTFSYAKWDAADAPEQIGLIVGLLSHAEASEALGGGSRGTERLAFLDPDWRVPIASLRLETVVD
jgi:hypothetical protein